MKATALLALGLGLLAAVASAAGPDWRALDGVPYDPPKLAPAFSLPDLEGKTVRLSDLRGKVVVLFFWATWCPDCQESVPTLNALYRDLQRRGLEVLLVNFREDPDLVKRTVAERHYLPPVLLDRDGDVTGKLYGVWGPPIAYVINRRGELLARVVGPRNWAAPPTRKLLEDLLAAR